MWHNNLAHKKTISKEPLRAYIDIYFGKSLVDLDPICMTFDILIAVVFETYTDNMIVLNRAPDYVRFLNTKILHIYKY